MARLFHIHLITAANAAGDACMTATGTGFEVPCAGALRMTPALAERDAG